MTWNPSVKRNTTVSLKKKKKKKKHFSIFLFFKKNRRLLAWPSQNPNFSYNFSTEPHSPSLIVIKPGPARRVDPGPGRPGAWTGPGNTKDRCKEKTGQTRPDPGDPARPGWPGLTRVRPGIYILTHLLNFYPNFLLCRSKFD